MTFPFNKLYYPPAAIVEFSLALPDEMPQIGPLEALIDTGSDSTLIPEHYLRALSLEEVGSARISGIVNGYREVSLYEVDIVVGGFRFPSVMVAGDDMRNEIIFGRNLLNKLVLLLDGPNAQTDLYETRPKIRP
ncbi:MAG TPA: aspartyl protease family protein [Anaerolineales bacterium]|nr:aspartyl protease family protein [Anaerolineales bacterium]